MYAKGSFERAPDSAEPAVPLLVSGNGNSTAASSRPTAAK